MTTDAKSGTSLRRAWASLTPSLATVDPVEFSPDQWALIGRLHAGFGDREAHTRLPLPIGRLRDAARDEAHGHARRLDDVETATVEDGSPAMLAAGGPPDPLARFARRFFDDVDAMMAVLVPRAVHRKGHYAYGRFTAPAPHGLHADHSAEDPGAGGEPICIARVGTLGTHYVAGDYEAHDAETRRMLHALRYWTAVPEGGPEEVLDALLRRGTLRTIPVDHVVLMVAGNRSAGSQPTQHIAARPPPGGLHSAFFQRQYRLT